MLIDDIINKKAKLTVYHKNKALSGFDIIKLFSKNLNISDIINFVDPDQKYVVIEVETISSSKEYLLYKWQQYISQDDIDIKQIDSYNKCLIDEGFDDILITDANNNPDIEQKIKNLLQYDNPDYYIKWE